MNESKSAPKLAPAQESAKIEKIKHTVTKKLYKHQKSQKSLHEELMPTSVQLFFELIGKVCMIFPAIVIGILAGIDAMFATAIKKGLEVYRGK